ncbi:MAG TPA: GNAT family N-acetyltransferase [Planctomycetota bacterium]|nr:GNAT family N-acetyltransferase [Planctomycetota bacterium]
MPCDATISSSMEKEVTTYHLEMLSPAEHRPASTTPPDFEVRRAGVPLPELNRFLYCTVGAGWTWIERLSWSRERWLAYLDRPELETWVAYSMGTPAGYFELERQPGENVELAYFGLIPEFTGRGLGGCLLTRAVERSWAMGPRRVWVHTCSLDHPRALGNYEARGFKVFRVEREMKEIPDITGSPWNA